MGTVADRGIKGYGGHWVYLHGEEQDLIGFIGSKQRR